MRKKTLIILISIVVLIIAVLIVGKKAGWFGKTGNFKEVETQQVMLMDIVEKVLSEIMMTPKL